MHRAASWSLCSLLVGLIGALAAVAGCGDNLDAVPSEILPASVYEARCETPRTGIDPFTDEEYLDVQGTVLDEQLWLRSWIDDTYLWYKEVPRADPRMFDTAVDYFDILKSDAKTASNKPKDQFHFTYDTDEWVSLSQSGVEASYGLSWALLKSSPPRNVVVADVQPGSPAAVAGIRRGAQALTIDGADVVNGNDIDTLNNGLFPDQPGQTHTLVIKDVGATSSRTVTLKSASIQLQPVRSQVLANNVGYLLFNDHIAPAEKALIEEIYKLKNAGVTELVLDLRYNGGGYLAIAAELGYMLAGPASMGKTFEKLQFNDKHPTIDPVTGRPLTPQGFPTTAYGFSAPQGQTLPHLDLKRVFVLTGSGTCSASEAVMNGLAGIDVQVIQIGATTCGKPYGFYPTDNCGVTYFAVQFQGVNAKGFGDYADGFVPGQSHTGCTVADDFTHDLGAPEEARLAAALHYMTSGTCPAQARLAEPAAEPIVPKPLWRQNAIRTR